MYNGNEVLRQHMTHDTMTTTHDTTHETHDTLDTHMTHTCTPHDTLTMNTHMTHTTQHSYITYFDVFIIIFAVTLRNSPF